MKIEVKALVRPVHLRDYAAEYEDATIWVWVNPPRQLRLDHVRLVEEFEAATDAIAQAAKDAKDRAEAEGRDIEAESPTDPALDAARARYAEQVEAFSHRIHAMLAEMWSQQDDPATHWTVEEVAAFDDACQDRDSRLWLWLQEEMWRLVREHREGVKKK